MTDSNNDNILDSLNENKTIKYAMKLIDRPASQLSEFKVKELGLQLVLFGLAEVQAMRVNQLAGLVFSMEKLVFDNDNLRELEPKKLIDLYRIGIDSLRETSEYVKSTLKTIDWAAVESQLLTIQTDVSHNDTTMSDSDVRRITNELVRNMKVDTNGQIVMLANYDTIPATIETSESAKS